MSEMVERVARALEEVYLVATDRNPDDWQAYARAAIEAMREPTGKMIAAADAAEDSNPYPGPHFPDAFRAMIDAALAEGTEAAPVVS